MIFSTSIQKSKSFCYHWRGYYNISQKKTIGFKIGGKVFCDIVMQNKGIRLFLNAKKGTLKDPEGITRDVSEVGHWGNGAYEVRFPLKTMLK